VLDAVQAISERAISERAVSKRAMSKRLLSLFSVSNDMNKDSSSLKDAKRL